MKRALTTLAVAADHGTFKDKKGDVKGNPPQGAAKADVVKAGWGHAKHRLR